MKPIKTSPSPKTWAEAADKLKDLQKPKDTLMDRLTRIEAMLKKDEHA